MSEAKHIRNLAAAESHLHDLEQRHMVESNNGKRRSNDHLLFLEEMVIRGKRLVQECKLLAA